MSRLKLVPTTNAFAADYQPLRRESQYPSPPTVVVVTTLAPQTRSKGTNEEPQLDDDVAQTMLNCLVAIDIFLNAVCEHLEEHGWQPLLLAYFLASVPVMNVVAILCIQKMI